ncbi:efflux RND transporter periplasmic adaptor subunit [Desulforhopalus singaporensis]|uniref:Membrane fusion protein, Cu(I)/Ag(I) efflux system n=1 Tax=Desulforhopalus singaporensis TaxID=91360 RepID=A0A1H0N984_9BACT|nr:efflux RND transporter periplasmic adaptor subunit [Desulforhopalus singaporensis]SDO89221.1 membrane fusion protein, Cu(I)/Ag(I) efflux system [Desulforhopalus singaporensis]
MKKIGAVVAGLIVGLVAGSLATWKAYPLLLSTIAPSTGVEEADAAKPDKKEPLYWVAPMDPNYRRDKPGKSPMGMDLVPVYEEEGGESDSGPGTVKISPDVVNNLGVRTAAVELKSMQSTIQTVGYVKYDEDQLVHIHPRVAGWIDRLYIKASGDPVKKGEPLYEIYSPELVNAQQELVLALDRKNSRLVEAAENRLFALRVPESLIAEIKKDGRVKQSVTFYAPRSGVVDYLNIRQGYYVNPGSTIMSIGTLSQVWVEAEVFERQASLVQIGLPVTMTLDYLPGREWRGAVDYVYPSLDPKTRTVRVRLRFDNGDNLLKPGMFAQVVISSPSSGKTLLVSKEAVIRSGRTSRVVLALGEGRFKSVNVKVGRIDEQSAEILSGLTESDMVVTSAQFLLDSESSKTSDFKRMNHGEVSVPDSVWVAATINKLMGDQRMVKATHKAIKVWDWPEMTMDFKVADSVDMQRLAEGEELHVEISRLGRDQYQITNIHIPGSEENKSLDDMSIDDMSLDDMNLGD